MKLSPGFTLMALLGLVSALDLAEAQQMPSTLQFVVAGSFANGSAESSNSVLITDNDLTNGYKSGWDMIDTPAALNPTGPAGSAAFQWGTAASSSVSSTYLHPSALWFQPLNIGALPPEQSFQLGYLYYRNGTIKPNSGAASVDIAMTLAFSQPLGIDPISVSFGTELINTQNSTDPIASADIVRLNNAVESLNFQDNLGNRYYMELTFAVDQDTIDGSLSTTDEFRVFEGKMGRATLMGRFTTDPIGPLGDTPMVPEPSSVLMGGLGLLFLLHRRR